MTFEAPMPGGSELIMMWARERRLPYRPRPEEEWFRKWEPFDTMVAPQHYVNGVTWTAPAGHVALIEPWTAPADTEPLERTVMAFVTHPHLRYRASMRVGEPFLTRVAFLEGPPPPEVKLDDEVWDKHVTTFARSAEDAKRGFHRRLRRLLAGWSFEGHLELRQGGLVIHQAGLYPRPEHYDALLRTANEVVGAALNYPAD